MEATKSTPLAKLAAIQPGENHGRLEIKNEYQMKIDQINLLNLPMKESPAPTVSTALTRGAGKCRNVL